MTLEEFEDFCHEIDRRAKEVMFPKNRDYSGMTDAVGNFKRHGRCLNISPQVVWRIYAGKHWDAITRYCSQGVAESEPIENRVLDLRNYCDLLLAIIEDERRRGDEAVKLEQLLPLDG